MKKVFICDANTHGQSPLCTFNMATTSCRIFDAKSALDCEGKRLRASELAGVSSWHKMSVRWKLNSNIIIIAQLLNGNTNRSAKCTNVVPTPYTDGLLRIIASCLDNCRPFSPPVAVIQVMAWLVQCVQHHIYVCIPWYPWNKNSKGHMSAVTVWHLTFCLWVWIL